MNYTATGRVQCIGRFSFVAPAAVNVTGRSQSIYLTTVTTIPTPSGGMDAYWIKRLPGPGTRQPGEFALQAGLKSVWSARNPMFPNILTLEVVKPISGGLIVVESEAQIGNQSIAETLVKDIVNSYVPANNRGFCLGNGSISLDPSQNEHVRLTMVDSSFPEIEIQFETQTVNEPDLRTYTNLDEERSLASGRGGTLTVLRDQQRFAAGLSGKEIWISFVVSGDKPGLRFTWHYPGVGSSSTQPSINILGSAPAEKKVQLAAIWETVLTSLSSVPLAAETK